MRALLYEAAQVMLTRGQKWSWLKAWAMNIAKRRGQKKAIVALERDHFRMKRNEVVFAFAGFEGFEQ